jgi:hypothetical protein
MTWHRVTFSTCVTQLSVPTVTHFGLSEGRAQSSRHQTATSGHRIYSVHFILQLHIVEKLSKMHEIVNVREELGKLDSCSCSTCPKSLKYFCQSADSLNSGSYWRQQQSSLRYGGKIIKLIFTMTLAGMESQRYDNWGHALVTSLSQFG